MERLPLYLQQKRALAARYEQAFSNIPNIRFFTEPRFARSNYWLNVLLLDDAFATQRDAVLESTHNSGIITRPAWELMHQLPMFADCPRMELDITENIAARLINLPSSPFLYQLSEDNGK